jgi:pantothenate kinase type III
VILAGLQLSLNALADGTGLLPHVDLFSAPQDTENKELIGINTSTALYAGTLQSVLGAVERITLSYQRQLGLADAECEVMITGGNARYLCDSLKMNQQEYLLLRGLKKMVLA